MRYKFLGSLSSLRMTLGADEDTGRLQLRRAW
ncbi:hypothetical protein [Enterobacter phage 01_vB_Eclo_IJM]|nr:hypothetical protein [Enterobacter phage 01_vB_Eclo_IJM]